jgi:hypothetical protein
MTRHSRVFNTAGETSGHKKKEKIMGATFRILEVRSKIGRAVAQAVSRWLPTAAARVRVRRVCGVCGGQSGTEVGFLRVLWFSLPIIPPISPSS